MFKLVVLSALVVLAVAKPQPSGIHGAVAYAAPAVAYAAPVVTHSAFVPTAVSHQSRVDVHSKPIVATTYTAPAVVAAVHAAPAVAYHGAPAVAYHAGVPAVTAYAAPGFVSHAGLVGHSGFVSHGVSPVAYASYY